jgi:hypothetical protein
VAPEIKKFKPMFVATRSLFGRLQKDFGLLIIRQYLAALYHTIQAEPAMVGDFRPKRVPGSGDLDLLHGRLANGFLYPSNCNRFPNPERKLNGLDTTPRGRSPCHHR